MLENEISLKFLNAKVYDFVSKENWGYQGLKSPVLLHLEMYSKWSLMSLKFNYKFDRVYGDKGRSKHETIMDFSSVF